MKKTRASLLVVIVMLAAACGPVVPLEIAMRQAVIDVFYGSPHKPVPTPSPTPVIVYTPPPPFHFTYPSPIPVRVTPSPTGCAALNPLAVAKNPATSFIAGAPTMGTFTLRSKGTYSLAATKGTLPAQLTMLRPDQPAPGSNQVDGSYFDYTLVTGFSATTYTEFDLRLAPNSATPGILLTGMKWRDSVRGNFDFVPQQPMQFLQTPVSIANSWSSAGWDAFNKTSIELQGSIPQKDTVNACGKPLDTYQLAISGNIVSPTFQLTWTGVYDIGTQYGGLILAEHVTLSGPDAIKNTGDSYAYDETSIINNEPPLAGP